jgi:hypothetical protein
MSVRLARHLGILYFCELRSQTAEYPAFDAPSQGNMKGSFGAQVGRGAFRNPLPGTVSPL